MNNVMLHCALAIDFCLFLSINVLFISFTLQEEGFCATLNENESNVLPTGRVKSAQ